MKAATNSQQRLALLYPQALRALLRLGAGSVATAARRAYGDGIDREEIAIKALPIIAVMMILLILVPYAWNYWHEWHAWERLIDTRERFSAVQRAYRDRVFRETPPPPKPTGERVRVRVGGKRGIIVVGERVR